MKVTEKQVEDAFGVFKDLFGPIEKFADQILSVEKPKPSKVLVTGITGQIGSYLAELYLDKGYEVCGIVRRTSNDNFENLKEISSRIKLFTADLTDNFSLLEVFNEVEPDIVINCAAQSEVGTSFSNPTTTFDITGKGVLNILEVIRKFHPKCRFLQFSSSEMYGSSKSTDINGQKVQNENTPFHPMSPYAVAKLAGYNMVQVYRESYGLFASNIIAFNSESPRRKDYFVTRKITKWLGEFLAAKQKSERDHNLTEGIYLDKEQKIIGLDDTWTNTVPYLALGNIDSVRSWTHAKDTALGAYAILNHRESGDFCIGRDDCHTVRDLLKTAFSYKGLEWKDFVYQDEKFMRPNDLVYLKPDCEKAQRTLGWLPTMTFTDLVHEMVDADYEKAKKALDS